MSEFKVIGAGLPRTGTNSLKLALEELLDGPCYHMFYLMSQGTELDYQFWEKSATPWELTKGDWKRLLTDRGIVAGVDYPISLFYKELMINYPDAKVILTVRSAESWIASIKNTFGTSSKQLKSFPVNIYVNFLKFLGNLKPGRGGGNRKEVPKVCLNLLKPFEEGDEAAAEYFSRWNEEVKAVVPPERLLIFKAEDGWEPLCKFLGVPIPDKPYPRTNSTRELNKRNPVPVLKAWFFVSFIGAGLAALGYHAYNTYLSKYIVL